MIGSSSDAAQRSFSLYEWVALLMIGFKWRLKRITCYFTLFVFIELSTDRFRVYKLESTMKDSNFIAAIYSTPNSKY